MTVVVPSEIISVLDSLTYYFPCLRWGLHLQDLQDRAKREKLLCKGTARLA